MLRRGAGFVHGPIPEERIEDAGQATGERDDGDLFAAAGGDVERPAAEGVSADGRSPENAEIGSPPTLSDNVPSPIAIGRRDRCWDWRTS
jgi:hypothetical protein